MKKLLGLWSLFFMMSVNAAEIVTKDIVYKDGKTELLGHIVHKEGIDVSKAPVIVVIHNWLGVTDETLLKARDMANEGYVAFVADIYGKGVRPTTQQEAWDTSSFYKKDLKLLRKRVDLAVKEARKLKSKNLFVAGYCFGGTSSIEYARAGGDIKGAISFHGNVYPSQDDKKIKSQLLVLHGALDSAISKEELDTFLASLDKNKVSYDFISYSGAVHSFTDTTRKDAESQKTNAAYNEKADKRSWNAFTYFVNDLSR